MDIPVESPSKPGLTADLLGMTDEDYAFNKAIIMLSNIKMVYGGTEVSYTLRKRKILKDFLRNYIKKNYGPRFDDLEETIAGLE